MRNKSRPARWTAESEKSALRPPRSELSRCTYHFCCLCMSTLAIFCSDGEGRRHAESFAVEAAGRDLGEEDASSSSPAICHLTRRDAERHLCYDCYDNTVMS